MALYQDALGGGLNRTTGVSGDTSGNPFRQMGPDDIIDPNTGRNKKNYSPNNPYWNQPGGQNDAKSAAYESFMRIFKRAPSEDELAQVVPAYIGSDPNITNLAAGDALVAQMHQAEVNSPENVEKRKQEEYKTNAPQFYGQVNDMYKQSLGRDATDAEKEHFGSLMATGAVDAYTIGQFLNALPENVQKQDEAFRNKFSADAQGRDAQYYKEQILPAIRSSLLKSGGTTEDSAYANSLALAAQQQNRQREGFLSGLTAQQYGNSQGLAQQAYQQAYGGFQGLQDYNRTRTDYLRDSITGRSNEFTDMSITKQSYDDYLRRYGKRNSGAQGAIGGATSGAAIGTSISPGYGTAIGAGLGGIAGYFGSQGGYG